MLATRTLVDRSGVPVEVTMFTPTLTEVGTSECVVRFNVGGTVDEYTTEGGDAFLSITLALHHIWRRVEELGCKTGSSPHEREHFFSRVILHAEPLHDTARLHAMIDAEEKRLDEAFDRKAGELRARWERDQKSGD